MNRFELKSKAYHDLEMIFEFIAKDNKSAAKKLVETFYKSFELLCTHPKLGRKLEGFSEKDVRFFVVKKHYLVVYKKSDETILILRVLSGYQDICSLL